MAGQPSRPAFGTVCGIALIVYAKFSAHGLTKTLARFVGFMLLDQAMNCCRHPALPSEGCKGLRCTRVRVA